MTFTGLLILALGLVFISLAGIPGINRRIRGLDVGGPTYKYWVFGAVGLGTLGSVVDHGSVNIALPTIASHFRTDLPTVQWVIIGYVLTISALILPMGRLSDLVGHTKIYISGTAVFILGAVLAGASPSLLMLILARVIQGCGAAMTQGTGMAIIISSFPSEERGRAIGLIMTVVGVGMVAGPSIGGFVVDAFGWPFVFFLNVITGGLGIAAVVAIVKEDHSNRPAHDSNIGFDWPGAVLSAAALIVLLLAMTNAPKIGWTAPPIVAAIFAFPVLLGAFVWWESRTANPMLDLSLFQRPTFSFGISAQVLTFMGSSAVLFLMPFYLQGVLGYSPKSAGLILMPGALSMAVMGTLGGTLSDRFGRRWFTVGGLASTATGLFLLSRLTDGSTLPMVMAPLILTNCGMGLFYSPNASSVLAAVEREKFGIVSAMVNLTRNAANVTSLAMATAIVTATMGSLGFEPSLDAVGGATGSGVVHAFTVGMHNALLVMMGLIIISMAVSAVKGEQVRELRPVTPG